MDKMREEFEKWAANRGYNLKVDKHGSYVSIACWSSFEAWKASRAALFVELPPEHEQAYGAYDGVELRHALQQAGIKYE